MKIHQWLFAAYTATLFLLHGLSPLPFVSFGFFLALGAFALVCVTPGAIGSLSFRRDDAAFGLIFLLGVAPLLLKGGAIGEQNVEYAALWFVIWLVCFWWVREWALMSRISFMAMARAAALGIALLSIAVTVEFVMVNTTGLYLSDIFPFSVDEFPFATILGTAFVRPRGFSAEPGFSAIVFNCLIPFSTYYILKHRSQMAFWIAVSTPGYLLLGSAASLMCFVITAALFLLIINRSLIVTLASAAVTAVVGAAFVFSSSLQGLYYQIIGRKIDALFDPLSTDVTSYSRSEAYRYGIRILQEHPLGLGWGQFSQAYKDADVLANEIPKGSGLLSVPLEIAVAAGIIAACLFFFLLYRKLQPLMRIGSLEARIAFFSLTWVGLHHMFVLELWFPMLWFSLAVADVVRIRASEADAHYPGVIASIHAEPGAQPISPPSRRPRPA